MMVFKNILTNAFYSTTKAQVVLLGIICFCVAGMFNALNSMGGGGQKSVSVGANANFALGLAFGIFGFFSSAVVNRLGVRIPLFVSCIVYAIYTASYILLNETGIAAITIVMGGILGVFAAILWTVQGTLITSYPVENEKGAFIWIFWMIFSLGGVLGSVVPILFGLEGKPLPSGGYIVFELIQLFGALLVLLLKPPGKVSRSDGTLVCVVDEKNTFTELKEIFKLFGNKYILLLAPLSLYSNFYTAYEFGVYNINNFDTNSRGFNNAFYFFAAMLASFAFSKLLDSKLSRKKRGLISTTTLYVFLNAVWISAYFQHKKFQQIFGDVQNDNVKKLYSYKSTGGAYVWPCLIYAFFGMLDAMIQSLLMWLVGCIGVNNVILSRYVAFVKSTQSVGSGIAWALNAQKINGLVLFLITCVLHLLSMPSTLYLCFTFQDAEKDESECHTERDNRDVPNSPTHASFRESTS